MDKTTVGIIVIAIPAGIAFYRLDGTSTAMLF